MKQKVTAQQLGFLYKCDFIRKTSVNKYRVYYRKIYVSSHTHTHVMSMFVHIVGVCVRESEGNRSERVYNISNEPQ